MGTFWVLLRNSGRVFESTLKGGSMEPTIPDGATVRISPQQAETYEVGQIVACVLNDELFAHRIVYCAPAVVLTRGDNRLLCDTPTKRSDILGVVIEYGVAGQWRVPQLGRSSSRFLHAISACHALLIRACLPVHYEFARRVAGTSLHIGVLFKRALSAMGRE